MVVAFQPDAAAVLVDDLAANVETQAEAGDVSVAVDLVIGVEDAISLVCREALALILNACDDLAVLDAYSDRDGAVFRPVLYGIIDEVDQDLAQTVGIAVEQYQVGGMDGNCGVGLDNLHLAVNFMHQLGVVQLGHLEVQEMKLLIELLRKARQPHEAQGSEW